ncbi:FAD-linked sulfhydryl oxidase ALR [Thelohanellus kitauei]|uniref:Sulfhydryl oxidase n=1 Tax=Thelohanellus kitauei TaxID=669202 RepID=A0A0C2N5F9_THEKT|nr:FAD-linked sulfhydryl oxidase ALR [Thelohanellus kitauei]
MSFHSGENPRECRACSDYPLLKKLTKAADGHSCPPDRAELGRSTWTFLHTTAAYYPNQPTIEQQKSMEGLIKGLADFFPCKGCASHLRTLMSQNEFKPDVTSSDALSSWFCRVHNEVNKRLGRMGQKITRVGN